MQKRLTKWFLTALALSFSLGASAEVLEVYNWKAHPGKAQQMYDTMAKAKAIQESVGISVDVFNLQVGSDMTVDYVLRFDSMADWGAKKDAINTNSKWMALWAESSAAGNADLQSSLVGINLDPSIMADDFDNLVVYNVFVWQPSPGQAANLVARMIEAKAIHEDLGARIDIYSEGIGGTGNYHYVISAKSWTELAAVNTRMSESKAWSAFQAANDPNAATLIRSFSGQRAPL